MKRSTALIVDDGLSVRTALKKLLVREGYDVLTAADGAIALRLLESFRVDVIPGHRHAGDERPDVP